MKLFILYQHDREQLKKTLLKAINRVHDFPEAKIRLAHIYDQEGQTSKAIAILQEGLAITPDSPGLANNLAWLYCEHEPEKINEALRLAQRAYGSQPGSHRYPGLDILQKTDAGARKMDAGKSPGTGARQLRHSRPL